MIPVQGVILHPALQFPNLPPESGTLQRENTAGGFAHDNRFLPGMSGVEQPYLPQPPRVRLMRMSEQRDAALQLPRAFDERRLIVCADTVQVPVGQQQFIPTQLRCQLLGRVVWVVGIPRDHVQRQPRELRRQTSRVTVVVSQMEHRVRLLAAYRTEHPVHAGVRVREYQYPHVLVLHFCCGAGWDATGVGMRVLFREKEPKSFWRFLRNLLFTGVGYRVSAAAPSPSAAQSQTHSPPAAAVSPAASCIP